MSGKPTDKQLAALAKLGRSKLGRKILREHGAAIVSLMMR